MISADYIKVRLWFKETAITSRARMQYKDTYIVVMRDSDAPQRFGIGECALFSDLSKEDSPLFEELLANACKDPLNPPQISSICFGFESAFRDMVNGGKQLLYDNQFTHEKGSMRINGLIWMGDKRIMKKRLIAKLKDGFSCIKIKIGGIDFEEELSLLSYLRKEFSPDDVELRVDANGAFSPETALSKLYKLSEFSIHSIEQPIRPGQWDVMAELCRRSPIPIALDEELIGFSSAEHKGKLLDTIQPQFIILKPSLCGGLVEADKWIEEAKNRDIGWWATSALESNIGLNAIAQWVGGYSPIIPQGLGTGALFVENFPSHLTLNGEKLNFNPESISSENLWRKAIHMANEKYIN